MKVTLIETSNYYKTYWRWKVMTDGEAGFYMSGSCDSYRCACRQAKRAVKRLSGIGWLAYDKKEIK